MQTQAERDVRGAMLLEKIAEAEKVEISKDEIDEEIGKLADYYRTTPDEIRSSLENQGGGATIENNLRTRKSIEALIAKAKVVDGEWIDEAAEAQKAVEAASGSDVEKPKKAAKKKAPAKKTAKASGKDSE
jgi:FKBP-type peptidyl-prolyl cis-trans isomerase (trigger factor)